MKIITTSLCYWVLSLPLMVAATELPQLDVNNYRDPYVQPILESGDTCRSTWTCHTKPSIDQTLDDTITNWSSITQTNTHIALKVGDYTGLGTLTLTAAGTSGTRKWLTCVKSDGTTVVDNPVGVTEANRCKIRKITMSTSSFWILYKLTLDGDDGSSTAPLLNGPNGDITSDIILSHSLLQDFDCSGACGAVRLRDQHDDWLVQYTVIRGGDPRVDDDQNGIQIHKSADNFTVASSELFDNTKEIFCTAPNDGCPGIKISNNDLYRTTAVRTDCSGNLSVGGNCNATKSNISFKGSGTEANNALVSHNRMWGARKIDSGACCTAGGPGNNLTLSNNTAGQLSGSYTLIVHNIIFDGQKGITVTRSGAKFNSIIGNIFYNFQDHSGDGGVTCIAHTQGGDSTEGYLNTFIQCDDSGANSNWLITDGSAGDSDWRCNVTIDSGDHTATQDANTEIDYNVFYNATTITTESPGTNINNSINNRANDTAYSLGDIIRTDGDPVSNCTSTSDPACYLYAVTTAGNTASSDPGYCVVLGCSQTDGTVVLAAVRAPLVHRRKLLTVAAGEQFIIPYARALNTSDLPENAACPSTGETDALGSRASIGINDCEVGESGCFMNTDLQATTR